MDPKEYVRVFNDPQKRKTKEKDICLLKYRKTHVSRPKKMYNLVPEFYDRVPDLTREFRDPRSTFIEPETVYLPWRLIVRAPKYLRES